MEERQMFKVIQLRWNSSTIKPPCACRLGNLQKFTVFFQMETITLRKNKDISSGYSGRRDLSLSVDICIGRFSAGKEQPSIIESSLPGIAAGEFALLQGS